MSEPVGFIVLHPIDTLVWSDTLRISASQIEGISGGINANISLTSGRSIKVRESANEVNALLKVNFENTLRVTLKLSKDIASEFLEKED